MKRILLLVVAIAISLTAVLGRADSGHASPTVTLLPSLRIHPILQYGAQTQPNQTVRVIVQKTGLGVLSQPIALLVGGTVVEEFNSLGSFVMNVPQGNVPLLSNSLLVAFVSPDGPVLRHTAPLVDTSLLKTDYPAVVNADQAWNDPAFAVTGAGVTVAVIDSGVNAAHPDLQGRVTAVNVNAQTPSALDQVGHGTHVAGIIAGNDTTGAKGEYIGIAPAAKIVSVKIADDTGAARESDLLRGMQWVYQNRTAYHIRAVNISVSAGTPSSYLTSPTAAAAERLWFSGVVVVAAAGNNGAGTSSEWYAPANDPYVITVGCVDDAQTAATGDDSVCSFSSRGRTVEGYAKPDVMAPGRRIVSTLAGPSAMLATEFPDRITGGSYIRLSGTSMSAPVVTGSIALLLQKYPTLTPNQVKWLLVATDRAYPGQQDAAGLVDVHAALQRAKAGQIGAANGGPILPSVGWLAATSLLPLDIVHLASGYWDADNWESGYWDSGYWDSGYWDSGYWDSGYWDNGYWDADPHND